MKQCEYEVTIRRTEICHVRVKAVSREEAVELAANLEALGEIANHEYADERITAERVVA